jgi:multiple sugar transport system permease protein
MSCLWLRAGRSWRASLGSAAIVVFCLAPFYWMLATSFRRPSEQYSGRIFPWPLSVGSYQTAFGSHNGFARALLNSLIVASLTTTLTLLIGIGAAYAIVRLTFPGKRIVVALIIATSMFPGISLLVPLLKAFIALHWINTYQALVVPDMSFALPLTIFNLTAYLRQLPGQLEEAALIDGCSRAQAFRRVLLPLAAPGVFTSAILTFIAAWNEFIIALSVTTEPSMRTAPVITALFGSEQHYYVPFGTLMAAGTVVTVPLIAVVLVFQRRIITGLTAGGVK